MSQGCDKRILVVAERYDAGIISQA